MSTTQLIHELEKNDFILPKDILGDITEEELIIQIEEIYSNHQEKLNKDIVFRNKYIELVAYLFFLNAQKEKSKKATKPFSDKLIEYLLSFPDGA